MRKEWFTYGNEITGEETKVYMTKSSLNTYWEVTDIKKYSPLIVFNPWVPAGTGKRMIFKYKMPVRVWNRNYEKAMEGINKMAIIVYKYYNGRTEEARQVNRDKHENLFNPIFQWTIDDQLYIVEWHSRAEYIELRKVNRICYKMYKTRFLYRTEGSDLIEEEERRIWRYEERSDDGCSEVMTGTT